MITFKEKVRRILARNVSSRSDDDYLIYLFYKDNLKEQLDDSKSGPKISAYGVAHTVQMCIRYRADYRKEYPGNPDIEKRRLKNGSKMKEEFRK